jgi:hypothetical protein
MDGIPETTASQRSPGEGRRDPDRQRPNRAGPAGGSSNGSALAGSGSAGVGQVDETALLLRYVESRDPALKEELVKRFLPLARSLALRYRGASEQLEDLIQVASLGLDGAAHRLCFRHRNRLPFA